MPGRRSSLATNLAREKTWPARNAHRGEVELGQLIDGGADAIGILVQGSWFPSFECAVEALDECDPDELADAYAAAVPEG